MTLYFDSRVEFLDSDAVSTIGCWHPNEPIFAVASHSQERGGSVTIFSDIGEPEKDVTFPIDPTSQVTALAWHPEARVLTTGWENGYIYVWFTGYREFARVPGPHKAAITYFQFSEMGGRLVSADSMGLLTGWRYNGKNQFLTMFSHDLREHILFITFRKVIDNEINEEIINLAKAAVAGDESALDTLTNWRPRTASRALQHSITKENFCFYVGTQSGVVYYINQAGTSTEVLQNNSIPVRQMLWHPKKDAVICLMEDFTVIMFLVESTGILTELDRVKLNGRSAGNNSIIAWAGNGVAITTGELWVRLWDVEQGDNILLQIDLQNDNGDSNNDPLFSYGIGADVTQKQQAHNVNKKHIPKQHSKIDEYFTCLVYSQINQTLCAGTNQGSVYIWKRIVDQVIPSLENSWQLTNISSVRGGVKQCFWGVNELAKPCIMIISTSSVYILREQPLLFYYTRDLWAIQKSAKSIQLEHTSGQQCTVQADFSTTALTLNQFYLILSNGRSITSYKIELNVNDRENSLKESDDNPSTTFNVQKIQTFGADCLAIYIQNQNIFCLSSNDVMIYSIGGIILNKIQASDSEGKIIGLDLTNTYLTIFTIKGFIRTYDVSRHDPKPLFPSKCGYDLFEDFGEVIIAKCNSIGTHLAIIIANQNLVPKSIVCCWNFERNVLMHYKINESTLQRQSLPYSVYWDTDEDRLLALEIKSVCQKECQQNSNSKQTHNFASNEGNLISFVESKIIVLFYSDKELHLLETMNLISGEQLINLCIPNVIILNMSGLINKPLQDFVDLNCDTNTRKSVLKFSLYVAEGNMDQAYRCIRSIESKTIWSNLAKMCVESKRLDIAKVCLGKLEKVRSVRAVRQAMDDEDLELDAKIAVLAIELGMTEKGHELYKSCGRGDLRNKLFQSSGKLNEALDISQAEDRVNLKNTYFHLGQEMRDAGDIKKALEYFEKTHNPVQNITNLLLENPDMLRQYMENTSDPQMLKWWGQYVESSGDMESALAIYRKAEDWFSQVKILCYLGKIAKADSIARQSDDRAACYHLARHYENIGKFQEAIIFYGKAQTFGNAIRICKENDFQDELWAVASSARGPDKAVAASYFEENGSYKRAVELYHRAGMLHKALEMAFQSEQPEILEVIAADLTHESDPELIFRCGDFFTNIEQPQKSVLLYARTKHFERALRLCSDKNVPITEALADMLTPNKNDVNDKMYTSLLIKLGELLQEQGDYQNATKKFTQAGDKIRAMKSLLKSGNTEKIIFFANIARQREVYIMAANYLQALNWQENPNILKNITTFYSKGQAFDSLANFYAICAQIEIEDFHNYQKALKAMQEAAKCLSKLTHSQQALHNLQRAIAEVKRILDLEEALENGDYKMVISGCRDLLSKAEIPPIKHVHIMAILIKALVFSKEYTESGRVLKELAAKEISWKSLGLLDKALVKKIADECNLDFQLLWNGAVRRESNNNIDFEEDEIKEDIRLS